jgi:hypothetical protein
VCPSHNRTRKVLGNQGYLSSHTLFDIRGRSEFSPPLGSDLLDKCLKQMSLAAMAFQRPHISHKSNATMLLADMGADVIKVETPQGDTVRGQGELMNGLSWYFASFNRNKRSVVLVTPRVEVRLTKRARNGAAKLRNSIAAQVKKELRKRMHQPLPEQERWLAQREDYHT